MSTSDLETRINDWIDSNSEWVEDSVEHTLKERNTAIDGSGESFYTVTVRFLEDQTKDNLLQKFTDKIKDKVDWYRVGYHSCSHDESQRHSCSWDDTTEWTAKDVTVPSGVPTFDATN